MADLKTCPFCGGDAEQIDIEEDEGFGNAGGSVIACKKCQCSTRVVFGRKEGLEDLWNERT